MSLACIASANFCHLKSSFQSSSSFIWFRLRACKTFGVTFSTRKCTFHQITTKAAGRNQGEQVDKPRSLNSNHLNGKERLSAAAFNSKALEPQELRNVKCFSPEPATSTSKSIEWPAVVIVFDIETTGFSHKDRIIEIAFRDLLGGSNSTFQTLINPEQSVDNSFVHGITTNMVRKPGVPRMKDLIPIILKYVESRQMHGKPVVFVAHNGRRFDVPFLAREFDRCSTAIPQDWLFVDTLPLGNKLVQDGKIPKAKLETLREHFGIPLHGSAHRAMQDVIVLSSVLQKLSFELKLSVSDLVDSAFRASDVKNTSSEKKENQKETK